MTRKKSWFRTGSRNDSRGRSGISINAISGAENWRKVRRPEIGEDFDREIHGRIPNDAPTSELSHPIEHRPGGETPVLVKRADRPCGRNYRIIPSL